MADLLFVHIVHLFFGFSKRVFMLVYTTSTKLWTFLYFAGKYIIIYFFYKRIPFSCHTCPLPLLWHEFDNCLCAIFCILKFHVVCTCTFFGDTICLLTNRKMIKIVTLIDWLIDWLIDLHIVLTYDCFLVSNIWASHALEMTINFYYPNLELFCFSFTQSFTHSKLCLPNPFLFGDTPPPDINNDQP